MTRHPHGKLPGAAGQGRALRDALFETPTEALGRINLWCSAMAVTAVLAIFAMWILTEVLR